MMFLIVTPPYDRAFPIQSLDELAPGRLNVLPERVYYSFLQLISTSPETAISTPFNSFEYLRLRKLVAPA